MNKHDYPNNAEEIKSRVSLLEIVKRYVSTPIKPKGGEHVCLCPFHKEKTPSFFINDSKGAYNCFGCGAKGDVFDFICAVENCLFPKAIEILKNLVGLYKTPEITEITEDWQPILPATEDAVVPVNIYSPKQKKYYTPTVEYLTELEMPATWKYTNENGETLFWIYRIKKADGGKIILPITYCQNKKGEKKWCAKAMKNDRPLLNIHDLALNPNKPFLIVEGEKTYSACKEIYGDKFVVLTWSGGTQAIHKTDWSLLIGKSGFIIPDNDNSGIKAVNEIQNIIGDNAEIITPKSELPNGWDIADCFEQWQERVSIMMFDADMTEQDAKQKATEEIEGEYFNILF